MNADKIKLYNVDCMELMKDFPDKYFELAIVDPPYGIGENGNRNKTSRKPNAAWKNRNSIIYKPFDDSRPPDAEYFKELFRVSKNQIIWGGNYFTDNLNPSPAWVIWDKKINENEHSSMVEMAWTSFKTKAMKYELLWAGFRKGEPTKRFHPTQKPVRLYKWLLENYAKKGDKILDTHLGSGSIAIACHELDYELIASELDTEYYQAAKARLEKYINENVPLPFLRI